MKNVGITPLMFLKRGTPFEGPLDNLFVVRDADGHEMKYLGAHAARVPIDQVKDTDFITLQPNEVKRIVIDIAPQYKFKHDGMYYIRIANPEDGHIAYKNVMKTIEEVLIRGTRAQKKVVKDAAILQLAEKSERVSFIQTTTGAREQSFKANCNQDHRAKLRRWSAEAKRWLEKAAQCQVDGGGYHCTENVKTWFNPDSRTKYKSSVRATLNHMIRKWEESDWDCDPPQCEDGVFAYVFPTMKSQLVHVCPFTFTYKVESEKMQTIIHELSHFDHIGVNEMKGYQQGERDEAYGEEKCKKLARTKPIRAMNNADNIGYFVRNVGLNTDPSCSDELSQCASWATGNHCGMSLSDGRAVTAVCKKSCGTCSRSPPPLNLKCTDKVTQCKDWKRKKYCGRQLTDGRSIRDMCKLSCNACGKPAPAPPQVDDEVHVQCGSREPKSCKQTIKKYNCNKRYKINGKMAFLKDFCGKSCRNPACSATSGKKSKSFFGSMYRSIFGDGK